MKVILLALLLTGCATGFEPDAFRTNLKIKVVILNEMPLINGGSVLGYSECLRGSCTLYVPPIKDYNDLNWCVWGHELGHGVYGSWHD